MLQKIYAMRQGELKILYVFFIALFFTSSIALAQKPGDFRSAGTGKWSNPGTKDSTAYSIWETYNGSTSSPWKIAFQADIGKDSVAMRIPGYDASSWVPAVVPGSVLTSYVAAGLEPDPDYGSNIRRIDSLKYGRNVWYRTEFNVPPGYIGKRMWLHFDGLNKYANIYVNNVHVGSQAGMMIRGSYDITKIVNTQGTNVIAVLINGMVYGQFNDFEMPSYMPSSGWDWMPPVPGLNVGITGKVYLSASQQVTMANPYLQTLALSSDNTSATLSLSIELTNHTDTAQTGILTAIVNPGNIKASATITLQPNQSMIYYYPNFNMSKPRLWWPNGSGDPNLYNCQMAFTINGQVSDSTSFNFGVRKYNYKNGPSGALNFYVNNKKIYVKGGCWGIPEYMLRVHGKDYDARIRLHKEMGMNMIRTWTGVETDPEFFEYCDKYGIMVWDEFCQNGSFTFSNDLPTFLANLPEKVKRERNYASVAIWCGDNEGRSFWDTMIEDTVLKYDLGQRLYHSTSNADNLLDTKESFFAQGQGGISADGGYSIQDLTNYFNKTPPTGYNIYTTSTYAGNYGFHPELGLPCFPTAESFKLFMPPADLWPINTDWTYDHYFGYSSSSQNRGAGASPGDYMSRISRQYGASSGIEDFCRKAQLMNIENHKAMFEGYTDHLWSDASGLLMWMSQPGYTTMIWQTYDYYLDCTGGYWGVKKACEPVHIQWSVASDSVKIINTTPNDLSGLTASVDVYNIDGSLAQGYSQKVSMSAKNDTTTFCFRALLAADLVVGKPAFSSSDQNATLVAANAFDGSLNSRWNSNFTSNEYVGADMGSPQSISNVILTWTGVYALSYKIQVSNDKVNWVDAYVNNNGKGQTENLTFPAVTGRYVRMLGITPATIYGYSLKEFQVYATPQTALSTTHFIKLKLTDGTGKILSDNFYWHSATMDYTALNNIFVVPLKQGGGVSTLPNGNKLITLRLTNPANSPGIALAVHVQLMNADGSRVLPVFMNDNYYSIVKGETKTFTIEFDPAIVKTGTPYLAIEQYNSHNPSAPVATGSILSPDSTIKLTTFIQNNKAFYQVSYNNQPVIKQSALGLIVNNANVNQVSKLDTLIASSHNETYPWRGVHSTAVNNYNEGQLSFQSLAGSTTAFTLDAKVFNNGVAFRYLVAGSGTSVVNADSTVFSIPATSTVWSQGDISQYEGTYQQQNISAVGNGQIAGPPATIQLPGTLGYVAITEGGNTNFAGLSLRGDGKSNFNVNLTGTTTLTGNIQTPWRVIEIGKDLNALVNCDIIADVSPKPDSTLFPQGFDTPWLVPGESVWSWLANNTLFGFSVNYSTMLQYSKKASALGMPYNLVDQGWERNFPNSTQTEWDVLKQLVDSSKAMNVKIWVWKPYSPQANAFFPDAGIEDSTLRVTFFTQCAQAGVAGIKVDYFTGETQTVMAWQEAALKDAAKLHLMLDFHGTDKPTGQIRTYPNEMTREGIRGLEHGSSNGWPFHNTTLPFTRFLAGHADYTPFSLRQDYIAGTTLTHQAATVITFTSPFMCLGVTPDSLLVSPVKALITGLPTTWDETRVLPPSQVGAVAVFARRKGTVWYLSALNGPNATNLSVNLSFLSSGSYNTTLYEDDPTSATKTVITTPTYTNSGSINVTLQPGGGLAAKFTQ